MRGLTGIGDYVHLVNEEFRLDRDFWDGVCWERSSVPLIFSTIVAATWVPKVFDGRPSI